MNRHRWLRRCWRWWQQQHGQTPDQQGHGLECEWRADAAVDARGTRTTKVEQKREQEPQRQRPSFRLCLQHRISRIQSGNAHHRWRPQQQRARFLRAWAHQAGRHHQHQPRVVCPKQMREPRRQQATAQREEQQGREESEERPVRQARKARNQHPIRRCCFLRRREAQPASCLLQHCPLSLHQHHNANGNTRVTHLWPQPARQRLRPGFWMQQETRL